MCSISFLRSANREAPLMVSPREQSDQILDTPLYLK